MVRCASILLQCAAVASGGHRVIDAFRPPSSPISSRQDASSSSSSHSHGRRRLSPSTTTEETRRGGVAALAMSNSRTDDEYTDTLAEETATAYDDLSREIDAALALALDALVLAGGGDDGVEVIASPDEADIDDIANMLLERPPAVLSQSLPRSPYPPVYPPPLPVISLGLDLGGDDDDDGNEGERSPSDPSEEVSAVTSLADILQKKAAEIIEEIERLRGTIFGIQSELEVVEASTLREEDLSNVIRKEIEESLMERDAMVKRIEMEFAAEKMSLVAQMETASAELKAVVEQCAMNVTDATSMATKKERELISRVDTVKAAIDRVTAEAIEINVDKENIVRSKQTLLDRVVEEGRDKLARLRKSHDVDIDYASRINADLVRRAEEAEGKVRDAFDQISLVRSERVLLERQIAVAENDALEEISSLQREMALDDERYAIALQKERDRLDKVIDDACRAHAERIREKIEKRIAVEAEYRERLGPINAKIAAAKAKQEARVEEYLTKLEARHKKERIKIYQEKFMAIAMIRERMNAELAIEYAKIEETKRTMQAKIDALHEQTANVKADFERKMAKKRQRAKVEEDAILLQIEDVRVDMTDKLKVQGRLYEEKKAAYLEEMNVRLSDSDAQLRQAWKELAGIKASYNDVNAKRENAQDDVATTQAVIDSYESDRSSFRKSLRLTVKVAKDKIGSKTRNLLRRNN